MWKPNKIFLIKMIPLLLSLAFLLLTMSLGVADPGSKPPTPK